MAAAAASKPISPFCLSSLLRHQKDPSAALKLFRNPNPQSPNPKKPFRYSLLSYDIIITKLGRAKMFEELETVLNQLKNDTRAVPKEILFCNVMGFYGRGRLADRALHLFDEMPLYRCKRTLKSVNSLLDVLLKCGEFERMREVVMGMERFGTPDVCTYNILIHWCCKRGCLDDAAEAFQEMVMKGFKPNEVTFGTLVTGFCKNSRVKEAFNLKDDMWRMYGVKPTVYVYASLIKALCEVGDSSFAFRLKDEMIEGGIRPDVAIYSTLISLVLKVGKKEEVSGILDEMREIGCRPDTVTYNVLISGLCKEKDFEAAFKVLDEMEDKGCKPDVISYNMMLGALCKEGRWGEATYLFEDMPRRGSAGDILSYRILFGGLSDVMQFDEAGVILDEMIFKGYKPRRDSLHKFVRGVCQEGKWEILERVFCSLNKGNDIDEDLWMVLISIMYKENDQSLVYDSIDSLTNL